MDGVDEGVVGVRRPGQTDAHLSRPRAIEARSSRAGVEYEPFRGAVDRDSDVDPPVEQLEGNGRDLCCVTGNAGYWESRSWCCGACKSGCSSYKSARCPRGQGSRHTVARVRLITPCSSSAAWAAARRAIGTRNGEQDT